MDVNQQNQSYWFVLREDQGNVIISSNNIATIQDQQIPVAAVAETPYITETVVRTTYAHEEQSESSDNLLVKKRKKEKDNFWDRDKIKLLLTLCLENKTVPKEILWNEISGILKASPAECCSKYKHLRRTYLRLLKEKRSGRHVKWAHYVTCEEVFTDLEALPSTVLEPWDEIKVKRMLDLYLENLPKFRSPLYLQKDIWKDIGTQLGTTGYNCYHKFKNLRRTYWNGLNRSGDKANNWLHKWAYHEHFERIYYNFEPTATQWDKHKIKLLLDAYIQIRHKFKNRKLQKKDLWKEISVKVGESATACDRKFRNLKQTYMRLKMKANSDRVTTRWRYYRDFEGIYSNVTRTYIDRDGTQKEVFNPQEADFKMDILQFYLDNKYKFRDPLIKNRSLWKEIAPKLGLSVEECDKQFRNMKQTYVRLACKKKQTGKESRWPYFSIMEQIFDESDFSVVNSAGPNVDINDMVKYEIRRVVEDVHERRYNDHKFEKLVHVAEESNNIQRERNKILQALLYRK